MLVVVALMACDHADQVTAIVSLNGANWNDTARCRPSEPVSVLAIHSSNDETVAFGGGEIDRVAYPSAATTVAQWLGYNRCAEPGRDAPGLDLVGDLPAAETSVRTYVQGCAGGSIVQAWTINGGSHVPRFGPGFAPAVTGFLLSRANPAGSRPGRAGTGGLWLQHAGNGADTPWSLCGLSDVRLFRMKPRGNRHCLDWLPRTA
jgi:poly(3-hydroxybutyrate) depolymerase